MAETEAPQTDWQAEHHKLQVKLDELHQTHQDALVAHAATLDEKDKAHTGELAAVNQSHHDGLIALAQQHAAELAAKDDAHEKHVAEIQALYGNKLNDQQSAHEKHLAEVKASVLLPALSDLHAREQADLAAKQKAALEALAKA